MVKKFKQYNGTTSVFATLFFFAVVILTGAIAGNTPLYDDDLVFANAWGCAEHTICPEEDFNPLYYAEQHRQLTNGRFGDMWTPLVTMIPGWCYGILYAGCFGIIIFQMMQIARLSFSKTPEKVIWLLIFCVLFFPWVDVLYTRAVFFNYFPAIIFSLIALRFFISSRSVKGGSLIGCIVVSFFAGCWHELMPVVLLPSAIAYCIMTKKITFNQWIVALSIASGIVFVIIAPSFFNRTEQLSELYFSESHKKIAILYVAVLVLIAVMTLVFFYYTKRKKQERKEFALIVSLLLPIIPSASIMLSSLFESRMILFAMILSLTALFYSLPSRKVISKPVRITVYVSTLILSGFVLWQLIYVVINTIKVKIVSENIMKQAVDNPNSPIYYDLRDILTNDKLYLYKTQSRSYINKLHNWDYFTDYTGYKYTYNILPPALKNFDLNKAEKIEGSEGYYFFDKYIVTESPCDSTNYIYGSLEVSFPNGQTASSQFMGTYFEDIHGTPLVYLFPYHPIIPREKPTAVKIVDFNLHSRLPK